VIMNQYLVPAWSTERTKAAETKTHKLCSDLKLVGNVVIAKGGYNAKLSGGHEQV